MAVLHAILCCAAALAIDPGAFAQDSSSPRVPEAPAKDANAPRPAPTGPERGGSAPAKRADPDAPQDDSSGEPGTRPVADATPARPRVTGGREFEVNPAPNEDERSAALEEIRDAVMVYADELDTVLLEAEDAVSTCERAPANGATVGGRPRFLEAQRARAAFSKDLARFERAVRSLERTAAAPVPARDAASVRSLVRAAQADLRALDGVADYLAARGDDKHEEVAKARAKLKSLRDGLLSVQRQHALRGIGLGVPPR